MVSRHGVRGPYGIDGDPIVSKDHLAQYSKNGIYFPVKGREWGTSTKEEELVTPKITQHGKEVIEIMAKVRYQSSC